VFILFILLRPARGSSIAISVYVCLSVRSHISKTTCSPSTIFSLHVNCGRGLVPVWRRYNILLCTSGFVNDVKFSHNEPYAHINNNPITALYVRESPKFAHATKNRGQGTRWWCPILDRKWKYRRFAHAQWKHMQYNPYYVLYEQFNHCELCYGTDTTFHIRYF